MRPLLVAIGFLTRLPVPRTDAGAAGFAAAIRCYPLVGMIVGAIVAATVAGGGLVNPWVGALAGVLVWTGVTGALHLDGLADVADGLGAAHGDRTRLLAVMRDPHVGSFGVVAITLQIAAKLVLLHAVPPAHAWTLIAVPFAARIGPLAWARWLPSLRPEGLGAAIAGAVRTRDLIGWTLVLAGVAAVQPALLAAVPLVAGVGWWFGRRLGGVSGDAHGAGIELVESGLLAAIVVAAL